MKLRSALMVTGLCLCAAAGAAQAETFTFTYTYDSIVASGTITATQTGANQYQATAITGMRGSDTILGLDPTYASASDFIYTSGPYLDLGGLSYLYGASASEANVFYSDGTFGFPGYGEVLNPPDPSGNINNSHSVTDVSFTLQSTVPLPASAPMFGAAVLALGVVGYRMKRKAASAA